MSLKIVAGAAAVLSLAVLEPDPVPLFLSGQSNAVLVADDLARAYPGPITTVAQSGAPIGHWNAADGRLWPATAAALEETRFGAIVFWQGESNRGPHEWRYPSDLAELVSRMRSRGRHASTRVVIVRVLEKQENAEIRRAQELFTQSDPNAVLVSSDGLGLATSDHLTPAGYADTARRIVEAARLRNTTASRY